MLKYLINPIKVKDLDIIINFISFLLSHLVSKIISFFSLIFITKMLSIEEFGLYRYYNLIFSYFIIFMNLGFEVYFLRKISDKEVDIESVLYIQYLSRISLFIFFLIVSVFFYFLNKIEKADIYFVLFFNTLTYVFDIGYLLKLKNRFKFLSILNVLSNLVFLFFVLINYNYIKFNKLFWLSIFSFINGVVFSFFGNLYLYRLFKISIYEVLSKYKTISISYIITNIKRSILINASILMISIYYNLDSLMIGFFLNDYHVAIYSTAYSFLVLFILPTNILYQVFIPVLSENKLSFNVLKKYFFYTSLLGVICFVILLLFHKFFILFAYGRKYYESIDILLYLSFDIIPCYIAGALANPINIWGYHKEYFLIVSSAALFNFLGNLIFIPKYGIFAAIITTILSEIIVIILALRFWYLNKDEFLNV